MGSFTAHVLRQYLGIAISEDVLVIAAGSVFLLNVLLSAWIVWSKGMRPNSALAWIATLFALPGLGLLIYLVIGENRVGAVRRRRHARIVREIAASKPAWKDGRALRLAMSLEDSQLARLAERLGAPPVLDGNAIQLSGDPEEQVRWIVADIDAATEHVHLLFYIYEDDRTGRRVSEALERAARRGVKVRLLVDGIGSRPFLRSAARRRLESAGVQVVPALRAGLLRVLVQRIDIRNHRKLVVVDGLVAQTGSRNIADPDFKASGRLGKDEPYVDSWVRIRGPLVRELQLVFCEDWAMDSGEDREHLELREPPMMPGGVGAQAIPSGPNFENSTVTALIQASIQLARRGICLSTPYFIPDEATINAMEVAARRGLRVTLVVPRANDSLWAAWASKAQFARLLRAGVEIWEFQPGFLHSKTVSVDDEIAIVTTANLDRRSYEINFETSVVVHDNGFAEQLRHLQSSYLAQSRRVDADRWARRPARQRFIEHFANLVSPLL
jgi:cardiolipin synthase